MLLPSDELKMYLVVLPSADAYNTTNTSVLDVRNYAQVEYEIQMGAVASGADITFVVQACNDETPDSTAASNFYYNTTADRGDDASAWTRAATYNYTCTDGEADRFIRIAVNVEDLKAAASTTFALGGVRLVITENVNKTVAGAVLAILRPARFANGAANMPAAVYA